MKNIEDIKEKIAKLLALADSPNENEAHVALLKARELMAKHKLRPEEVSRKESAKVIKRTVGITCTIMTNAWAAQLSAIIAEHYCCKAYRDRKHGAKKVEIGLVGLEDDFEICEQILKYAFDCVEAQCKKIRAEHKDGWASHTIRQMANSYGFGFCKGLHAAYKAQNHEHQEYGLVLVTPQVVIDVMANMGKPSNYGSYDNSGYYQQFVAQGYKHGTQFNPGAKLPSA